MNKLFIKKEQVKHKIIPSKFIAVFLQQIRLKAELVYAVHRYGDRLAFRLVTCCAATLLHVTIFIYYTTSPVFMEMYYSCTLEFI